MDIALHQHGGGGLVTKCPTLATPLTIACQAPLSMRFSRQEYWSGLPFPSPGDIPDPGLKQGSSALQADSLPTELQGKPLHQHPSFQISLQPAPAFLLFRVTGLQLSRSIVSDSL